jgi:hypothetical protein
MQQIEVSEEIFAAFNELQMNINDHSATEYTAENLVWFLVQLGIEWYEE